MVNLQDGRVMVLGGYLNLTNDNDSVKNANVNDHDINNANDVENNDNIEASSNDANDDNAVASTSPPNVRRSTRNIKPVDRHGAHVSHLHSNSKSENNHEHRKSVEF